jgi:integrase
MNAVVTMQTRVEDYLAERRRLGYRLRSTALALRSFARYVDGLDLSAPLSVEVMAAWARQAKTNSDDPTTWARRLKRLRPFTRWLQQFEPETEVPDSTVFGPIGWRPAPHIFTEQEIGDLLAAARRLEPDLRGATYETLFGVLAATGLRVSEAVHLRQADVDLHTGLLTVRQTKFGKSRYVPLHPSTTEALRGYQGRRNLYLSAREDTPFFVGTRGRRLGCELSLRQVDRIFQQLREQLGWVNRGSHAAVRVHDLRHSFIVSRLVRWHAQGVDIDQAMLALSTYVGHARVTNTYWYLSGVPELMGLAAERFAPPVQDTEVNHV